MGITRFAIEHYEYGRRPIPKWAQKLLECLLLAQLVEQKRQDGNQDFSCPESDLI
jgi:predicted anti-sigma-YlaC factor YlaD